MAAIDFRQLHGVSAKELLETLEQNHEFVAEPPVDVKRVGELLGMRFNENLSFDELDTVGSLSIKKGVPHVWLNPLENSYVPRKRFTIAHEIGHLILHIDPDAFVGGFVDTQKTLNRKESYWDSKEYEANNFAAQLLMPATLVKVHGRKIIGQYKEENGKDAMPVKEFVPRMAELFNVSEQAMRYRLKNIGIIK